MLKVKISKKANLYELVDKAGGEVIKSSIKLWVGTIAPIGTRFEVVKFTTP